MYIDSNVNIWQRYITSSIDICYITLRLSSKLFRRIISKEEEDDDDDDEEEEERRYYCEYSFSSYIIIHPSTWE